MQLTKNGLTIEVPDAVVVDLVLNRLAGNEPKVAPQFAIPRIGDLWRGQGGIYAGVMRGRAGAPDYHLLVGDAVAELKPIHWDKAMAAVVEMQCDGHKDYTLPYRAEQALLFANVPELFESEWYWSREQHAADSGYAWLQGFGYGYQGLYHKSSDYRARAVRRLVI